MRKTTKSPSEKVAMDIKGATCKQYSIEEKIGIVPDGLRGEDSIGEMCRREAYPRAFIASGPKTLWKLGRSV
ncbi:transposase [Shimia abyssi]|uniref:Transposase n=1 Tax=Shimia abyssi TaxID=1662395 RepID=A0A2P8F9D9_9RHOB|nr:hypothetical protein [Shimia abyssi]PSL18341.1 transposase [Shimia abyssi]